MEFQKTGEPKKEEHATHERRFLGLNKKQQLIVFSAMSAIIFGTAAIATHNPKLYGLFLGLGVIVAFVPYSVTLYLEKQVIQDIENNFPSFLKDLAEARKTGMTLPQAVYKSAQIDYGKLTPSIKKMSNQISWGIPFNDVLLRFARRTQSRFIDRAIAIIIEAQVSGGAITDTLDSVSDDARLIKELDKERKASLNQQVTIMYAIFFLFLAIVIALQRLMVPLLSSRGFSLTTEDPEEILGFYRNIFFSMITIQGIFNGLLAGQIGEGSAIAGLKHSAIFLISGVIIALIFIF